MPHQFPGGRVGCVSVCLCVCACACACAHAHVCTCTQLCPILCNPIDYSLPGSTAHEILQVGILEQVAISYPRGFSQSNPCLLHAALASGCFTTAPPRHIPEIKVNICPGFPSGSVVKRPPACQCKRHRFNPWSRKILQAHVPQLLKPMLHNESSHHNKKTMYCQQRVAPTCCN